VLTNKETCIDGSNFYQSILFLPRCCTVSPSKQRRRPSWHIITGSSRQRLSDFKKHRYSDRDPHRYSGDKSARGTTLVWFGSFAQPSPCNSPLIWYNYISSSVSRSMYSHSVTPNRIPFSTLAARDSNTAQVELTNKLLLRESLQIFQAVIQYPGFVRTVFDSNETDKPHFSFSFISASPQMSTVRQNRSPKSLTRSCYNNPIPSSRQCLRFHVDYRRKNTNKKKTIFTNLLVFCAYRPLAFMLMGARKTKKNVARYTVGALVSA
jgi:hypothetical protein